MAITTMDIKYQLFPPSNYIAINIEKSIQTFKNHFIEELCSIDKDFHLQSWHILLSHATISLNILKQSRILPHISSYTPLFGGFYYKRTPLYPPGTTIVIHNMPNDRVSWEPHL